VTARGWLVADNENRDMVRDLTLAGGGVARMLDWRRRPGNALANGSLVAVLTDWKVAEVPPVTLLYPPRVRRMPRVRTFIDFVTQLFRDIEQERNGAASATAAPGWLRSHKARASSSIGSDA
jgi:DNA-binding transcriptional LysR family regulator